MDSFVSTEIDSFLETSCLENHYFSFSLSNIKFDLCIQPIGSVLSPITRIQPLYLIMLSRISKKNCSTWVINSNRLMWSLPINYSGIIHWYASKVLLKAPTICPYVFPTIILLGNPKSSISMLVYSKATCKISFHSFRSCFTCFGIWKTWCVQKDFIPNALILFIKWAPVQTTTVIVSSTTVIYCSCLKHTVLLFITVSTWDKHAMNLCNGK